MNGNFLSLKIPQEIHKKIKGSTFENVSQMNMVKSCTEIKKKKIC
jgi:hypothetical protein